MKRHSGLLLAAAFAISSLALAGASCDKKSTTQPHALVSEHPEQSGDAQPSAQNGADPASALPGVDLTDLSGAKKSLLLKMADALPSACGKAHSLRTSLQKDPDCKRSVFAGRYVKRLVNEDFSEDEIKGFYAGRYLDTKHYQFKTNTAPFDGIPDAPIVMVEFFDYGCPHCREFKPVLEDVLAEFPSDVVLYYKHYVLGSFPNSGVAAAAAIAAQRQGKFREMHTKLFQNQGHQNPDDILRYAKEIGLDMAKFKSDMESTATRDLIEDNHSEGEDADMTGTPALFINGHVYSDPLDRDSLIDWIREQIMLNR